MQRENHSLLPGDPCLFFSSCTTVCDNTFHCVCIILESLIAVDEAVMALPLMGNSMQMSIFEVE